MEPEFKVYQQQWWRKTPKAMVEVFLNRGYKVVSGAALRTTCSLLWDPVDKNPTGKA